uniref:Uncharacterized protein n=1 Tax=Arundo donax TaxID=35708 RepID=A0A0A8ZUY3_ARUDO
MSARFCVCPRRSMACVKHPGRGTRSSIALWWRSGSASVSRSMASTRVARG